MAVGSKYSVETQRIPECRRRWSRTRWWRFQKTPKRVCGLGWWGHLYHWACALGEGAFVDSGWAGDSTWSLLFGEDVWNFASRYRPSTCVYRRTRMEPRYVLMFTNWHEMDVLRKWAVLCLPLIILHRITWMALSDCSLISLCTGRLSCEEARNLHYDLYWQFRSSTAAECNGSPSPPSSSNDSISRTFIFVFRFQGTFVW